MSSIVVQITGRPPIHDQPTAITGQQNAFGVTTTDEDFISAVMATDGPNTFYEETIEGLVPARTTRATFIFPASQFTADIFRIRVEVSVPNEDRGGTAMVEVWAPEFTSNEPTQQTTGTARVGSFRGNQAQFVESGDPAWEPLSRAFLSRQPISLYVSGFESFGSWTEPRAYAAPVTVRLTAWGQN